MSTYDRRTRDRYRQVVSGVTGVAGLGALTLTGGLMGMAAGEAAQDQEPQDATPQEATQQKADRPAERRSGLRERPQVTRVTTRYVTGGTATAQAPGPGGSVSAPEPAPAAEPAPEPAPQPAPEPDPPPAPSSGS